MEQDRGSEGTERVGGLEGQAERRDSQADRLDALEGQADRWGALDDVAFLTRTTHRVVALEMLTERPCDRTALRQETGVSASTISRTLREFETRSWVRSEGDRYEATRLGEFVAARVIGAVEEVRTERRLRDVWELLPTETSSLTVEMLTDAVVTVSETADPYGPVNRFLALLGGADEFRFVGSDLALFALCRDEVRAEVRNGTETELVNTPAAVRDFYRVYPDCWAGLEESDNLESLLHEELPDYGVGVFDDRVAISGYDPECRTVRVLVDTDSPAVREWAESTYERYRRDARPLRSFDALAVR